MLKDVLSSFVSANSERLFDGQGPVLALVLVCWGGKDCSFFQSVSVLSMVVQPALNRGPSMLISFLLKAVSSVGRPLRGMTKPPPM